jgi:serine/threonine protein kinase
MESRPQFDRIAALGCHLVRFEEFQIEGELGSGGFGDVHSAIHVKSGTPCAIKTFRKEELEGRDLTMFLRELEGLLQCRSPFLVSCIGYCDSAPFAIVTEVMPGGNLTHAIRSGIDGTFLTPTQLSLIALGAADGMATLHAAGLIHRDLKSGNILLDNRLFPKICDFGISRQQGGLQTQRIGTIAWMAPEAMLSKDYDQKVDVYSFGIVLWELVSKGVPWKGMTHAEIIRAVAIEHKRPVIPKWAPPELADLINRCWAQDPEERPTFDYIYHAFRSCAVLFAGTDEDLYLEQMRVMDALHSERPGNPLLGTFKSAAKRKLDMVAPSVFIEESIPGAPVVPEIAVQARPEIPRIPDEYTGNFGDFELLKGYLWQYPVALEVKRRAEREMEFLDGFVAAEGLSHLTFVAAEAFEIVRMALRRSPAAAAETVNWELMCELGISSFPQKVLHVYSLAAEARQFGENVFGPFLNRHRKFFTPELAPGFARIASAVYAAVKWPLIAKIFVAGLYAETGQLVDVFLRVLCASDLCNEIDEDILKHHIEHFGKPELLVSVLLRKEKLSLEHIPFLKQQIAVNSGAVVLLCRFAETEEGASELLRDLEWMNCEEALPIVLVLMQTPEAEAAIVKSPHFGRVQEMLAAYTDET